MVNSFFFCNFAGRKKEGVTKTELIDPNFIFVDDVCSQTFMKIKTVIYKIPSLKRRYAIKYFRHKFSSCGTNLFVYGSPRVISPDRIKLGSYVCLNDGCLLNATLSSIEIGDSCTISADAKILAATYDVERFITKRERYHIKKGIVIGENVWICSGAIVCPGVHIASNVIVGAGAVVTKDITEEYTIVAGNPAKVVKRFDKELPPVKTIEFHKYAV
jgi:acetyltransferase-like isoleucine patch superfamily enzyme